jgi:ComF family protein
MDGSVWSLALKNVFLPIFCCECGCALLTEENGFFCPACWTRSERIERPFCSVCGRPHRERVGFGTAGDFPCADCRGRRAAPYRRVWAACDYDGAIAEAIKRLKFNAKPRLAAPLAEEIRRYAEREMDVEGYDAIVPVPLHRVRRRSRGFNQAELIASALAPCFPRARVDTSLRRIRPTRTQSTLTSPAERKENVRGAFAVERDRSFEGERILLLDDVVTTGGTVAECARAVLRAGAKTVDVIAAAIPAGRRELDPIEEPGAADVRRRGPFAAAR